LTISRFVLRTFKKDEQRNESANTTSQGSDTSGKRPSLDWAISRQDCSITSAIKRHA
jgi:hypothetical protein